MADVPGALTPDELICNSGTSRSVPSTLRIRGEVRESYVRALWEQCPNYTTRGWHSEDCSPDCQAVQAELGALGQMLARGCATHVAQLLGGQAVTTPNPSPCLCAGSPHA